MIIFRCDSFDSTVFGRFLSSGKLAPELDLAVAEDARSETQAGPYEMVALSDAVRSAIIR
jgi:hypothetical protein